MLRYDPIVFAADFSVRLEEVLAPDCMAINLEIWNSETAKASAYATISAVDFDLGLAEGELGEIGRETLYVPADVPFTSAHYRALQKNLGIVTDAGTVERVTDIYPDDGTLTPERLHSLPDLNSSLLGCPSDPSSVGWNVSTCQHGRW